MKNYQKGFITPLVWGIVALLAVGLGSYIYINQSSNTPVATTSYSSVNTQATSSTQNQPSTLNSNNLTDAQFIAAGSDDPQAKVVARGDINGDGYEDAIVQEVHCGASCSIGLQVVFNDHNSSAKLFHSTKYETFEPAYMSSSAAKSEITNISIKNGIISLTGMGLACTTPGTEEACTQEKWNVVRTVTYKFNGTDIVQLSVVSLTQNLPSSSENILTDGYSLNYDYQINPNGSNGKPIDDYLFKTKGQKIIIPTNISAVFDGNIRQNLTGGTLKGESLSSHFFLSNPVEPSTVFFSTDNQEWTDTSCKITSSIYKYNIDTQTLSKMFSQSESGPAYSCRGLRTIGVQGRNLLLYKTSTDNSPGPCFDPLIDFNKQFDSLLSLNIDNPNSGVVSYTPSANVIDIESKKEKDCVANLANI
jgi:hypothetical protein